MSRHNFQGLRCWYCGDDAKSRDHLKKRGQKRRCDRKNMVAACHRCNSVKQQMSVEEFRKAIAEWASSNDSKPHRWRIVQKLKPWKLVFYGERGGASATLLPRTVSTQSQPFKYRWKAKAPRNTGPMAVVIEECAKRGKFAEVQGGLMNQSAPKGR